MCEINKANFFRCTIFYFLPSSDCALVRETVAAAPFRGKRGGVLPLPVLRFCLKLVSSSTVFFHVFLAKPWQSLLCHIAWFICTRTCLKAFTGNFFLGNLYWFTAGGPRLAFRVQVELTGKAETLLLLLWASVSHLQREDGGRPTAPFGDVGGMSVSRCSGTHVMDR